MKKNNSVNKSKLEALKKEVIEILKNQAEKEYKKALNHFLREEENYSYLTKSISGEWIEKAGFGINTVRIWNGNKYRKVAPGKWVRIYEKEGRGTNIAVGKLIAQVKKIDNIEDLMNFALAHKQRFQDKNGMDLPILDKIRAAVDEQNEKISSGNVESKGKSENTVKKETKTSSAEKQDKDFSKYSISELEKIKKDAMEKYKNAKTEEEEEDALEIRNKANAQIRIHNYVKLPMKRVLNTIVSNEDKENYLTERIKDTKINIQKLEESIKRTTNANNRNIKIDKLNELKENEKGFEQLLNELKVEIAVKKEDENKTYWIQDSRGNRVTNEDAKKRLMADIENLKEYKNEYLFERLNPEDRKEIESEFEKKKDLPKKEEKMIGKLPSGYVNDLSIEKQGELNKLLKEHFISSGMSGMEIAEALDNAMDSKISDLEEIYNKNEKIKELLLDSGSPNFKMSDIYDSKTHDEMKKIESFEDAKNVIKQIADNYGASEKGRKLLENFMAYNVGGGNPIYDKIYKQFGISTYDLDADFDSSHNKLLKLAAGQKDVKIEEKQIQQSKDDFASRYRAAIEQEDRNFQKNEKSKKAKIKKSLEDILLLLNEDEEEEDYNDYSAENPELFNSVAYRVANAFEECGY